MAINLQRIFCKNIIRTSIGTSEINAIRQSSTEATNVQLNVNQKVNEHDTITTKNHQKHVVSPLTDSFGRFHSYLRISLTEKCNLRFLGIFKPADHLNLMNLHTRSYSTNLTHVDESGKVSMVNVIDKLDTKRMAVACGSVDVGPKIAELISCNMMKKGDVLSISQIAGIMGAKNTSNLIPLTHNIALSSIKVDVKLDTENHCVEIQARVECFGKTGVEIEALTAVSIAALTIYDMCKAVSHDITINKIQLMEKSGGKSHFRRI